MSASEPTVFGAGPVWAKRVDGSAISALNVSYCAGRDVVGRPPADLTLIPYDLALNMAHAVMLGETGILPARQAATLRSALASIRAQWEDGVVVLNPEAEDIHMSIEQRVGAIAGADAGGRLHTARSRNDQVATDMRMLLRDVIADLVAEIHGAVVRMAAHARKHTATPIPGWTHMQPAMLTTWGHWVAGNVARLVRDMRALALLLDDLVECPLGGAACFGTSWPIDRERTAALLGFERPTRSTVDAIWSRGEIEARFAAAASILVGHLSGVGQDLILLSTPPREWVRLPDTFVTGSSIMPQKRNPDFAEVTRARAATVAGLAQSLFTLTAGMPMGYNRDTQWTKYLAMDVVAESVGVAGIFGHVFEGLEVNTVAMREACHQGFLNATDVADYLARTRNLPFRSIYRVMGTAVQASESNGELTMEAINSGLVELGSSIRPLTREEFRSLLDVDALIAQRDQPGSPKPERVLASLDSFEAEAHALADSVAARASAWRHALDRLFDQDFLDNIAS